MRLAHLGCSHELLQEIHGSSGYMRGAHLARLQMWRAAEVLSAMQAKFLPARPAWTLAILSPGLLALNWMFTLQTCMVETSGWEAVN